YISTGLIGILIYLSYHLFYSPLFLNLQPYLLISYFIAYAFIVYKKIKSLEITKYLPVLIIYILLFWGVLLYEYFNGRSSMYWIYETVLQLSVAGTSILIGYGIIYIISKIREIK